MARSRRQRVRRPGRTGGEIKPIGWARSYLHLAEGLDHGAAGRIGVEREEDALAAVEPIPSKFLAGIPSARKSERRWPPLLLSKNRTSPPDEIAESPDNQFLIDTWQGGTAYSREI